MKTALKKAYYYLPLEALVWLVALLGLALVHPDNPHFSLCPLANAGFTFCPGCGLGHSVSYFLRGEIQASFDAHPLGIFTVFVLSYRIIILTRNYIKAYGTRN